MPGWRRGSGCDHSTCVEVARTATDRILVRDSRGEESPILAFDRDEWRVFVAGVKAGEFDID